MVNNRTKEKPEDVRLILSKNFHDRLRKLLPEVKYTPRSAEHIMTTDVSIKEESVGESVVFPLAYIIDSSTDMIRLAELKDPKSVIEIQKDLEIAKSTVTEQELIDRFTDYQIAITQLIGTQHALENIAKEIFEKKIDNSNISRLSLFLTKIKNAITLAFNRLYKVLANIKDTISKQIQDLIDNLGIWIKDKVDQILDKIHDIISSISQFFAIALSKMIEWISIVKEIAENRGFTLKSVKISIEPANVRTIPILGFPIPIIEFKMPKIDFEFGK